MEYVDFFNTVSNAVGRWAQARQENDDFIQWFSANELTAFRSQVEQLTLSVDLALQPVFLQLKNLIEELLLQHDTSNFHQTETETLKSVPKKIYRGGRGRPKFCVPIEDCTMLLRTGMTWKCISLYLSISERTLRRNKGQIPDLAQISDDDLREELRYLKEENPFCGTVYALGHLRAFGYKVPRERVRQMLREMDPFGTIHKRRLKTLRCIYFVPGPNYLWHMDGNEKLQPFSIYIHGMVDGYSRKPLYLFCASNKKPSTIFKVFEKAVQDYGYPLKIRSDFGRENTAVARHMLIKFGFEKNSFSTGKSTHNTRIERFWKEVNKISWQYRRMFMYLRNEMLYDSDSLVDRFCLHYIFLPRIQRSLDSFRLLWDFHKIRTAKSKSPNELYLTGSFPTPRTSLQERNLENEELEEINPEIEELEEINPENDELEEIDETLNPYLLARATEFLPFPCEDDGTKGIGWYIMLRDFLTEPE